MRNQTVNVRVPKAKLLTALKQALEVKVKEKADYDKAEKSKEQALEDIKKSIVALVKSGKLTVKEVGFPYSYRHADTDTKTVEVIFTHKLVMPKNPIENYNEHSNQTAREEIANAIRVLEMSDEEFVKTSSYGSVARYL